MDCPDPYASALLTLKHGDPAARDDAMRTLMTLVVPIARRMSARFQEHHLDPADLAQEVQLSLIRFSKGYKYDPTRPAAPLVTCVAYRAAWSAAHSLARQRPLTTWSLEYELFRGSHYTVGDVVEDPDSPRPADAFADSHDARLALRILNDELSKLERAVWIARTIYEMPYSDIATALSVGRKKPLTVKGVDNALKRANEKFARIQRVGRIRESECRMGRGRV